MLNRLSDFHLLLYLQKRVPDLAPLLAVVREAAVGMKRHGKKPPPEGASPGGAGSLGAPELPPYYVAILEQLCSSSEEEP